MTTIPRFAPDYSTARRAFQDAAAAAGARVASIAHPLTGPSGEPLATDIAWIGPEAADAVLVLMSGTHGIEGLCGSGCQTAWLNSGEAAQLPPGIAVMLVHAINPHGFAWMRRVNEDNVDLNRNWIDFSQPPPVNAGYDRLREAICPRDWSGPGRIVAEARLSAYGDQHGERALQAAISGGQWADATGVFYGGAAPSWSRRTVTALFAAHLAPRIAILDIHTGLGPYGACERIVTAAPGSPAFARASAWYGLALTSPQGGDSTSAPVVGDMLSAAPGLAPEAEVTGIALEFGVQPTSTMLDAVRADAWLHNHGDLASEAGRQIAAQMREAFIGDTPQWEGMVVGQTLMSCRQAVAGLARRTQNNQGT